MDREQMEKDDLVASYNGVRTDIKQTATHLKLLTDLTKRGNVDPRDGEDRAEMIANLMLAYRHLEDASMRLGKAIQARDGGTSVYDKATTVGA
jgi:hypothetical protein